jgi:hypothetical protein
MADNSERLLSVIEAILEQASQPLLPDAVATEAARRDPGVLLLTETAMDFIKRVRQLLKDKGLLTGEYAAGAGVKSRMQRRLEGAGFSLTDVRRQAVADSMLSSGNCPSRTPYSPSRATSQQVKLALDDRMVIAAAEGGREANVQLLLGESYGPESMPSGEATEADLEEMRALLREGDHAFRTLPRENRKTRLLLVRTMRLVSTFLDTKRKAPEILLNELADLIGVAER